MNTISVNAYSIQFFSAVWFDCSSMISLIPSSTHPRLLHYLLLCSWTTHLTTRIVQRIGECHGGLNLELLKEIAEMKSFTPFLSTSTGSSLHHKRLCFIMNVRGKASFPDKNSSVMMICVRLKKNERNIYVFSGCRGMISSALCSIFLIILYIAKDLFIPIFSHTNQYQA